MIDVQNLTKRYGRTTAVDGISFKVEKGEILGFLGPNGAGKTTTMRILTCYLPATDGTASVAGYDVFKNPLEVKKRVGYLPETPPLYPDMQVGEFLEFCARIKGVAPAQRAARLDEAIGKARVGDVRGKQIGRLSKGYRQRVGLAQAMLHDPDIVILDEPTSGLDPNQIVEIRSLIKEIGQEKTVILSTHILPEVQATCSRVVIISGGKLVADGTPDELRKRERGGRYRVVVESNGVPKDAIRDRLASLAGVASCEVIAAEDGSHAFAIDGGSGGDLRKPIFRAAVDNRWTLLELARESASLEDVFRNLTTGEEVKS